MCALIKVLHNRIVCVCFLFHLEETKEILEQKKPNYCVLTLSKAFLLSFSSRLLCGDKEILLSENNDIVSIHTSVCSPPATLFCQSYLVRRNMEDNRRLFLFYNRKVFFKIKCNTVTQCEQ